MTSKRICFVLPSAYGYFNTDVDVVGGGARQLSFISRQLVNKFDVHFVVGDYGQPKREMYDGVTLHRSYSPSPETPRWEKPFQLQKLFTAMKKADADLYVYRGRPFQAVVVYILSKVLGAKWVYNLANDPNIDEQPAALPFLFRRAFIYSLFDADAIITQTKAQAQRLRGIHGVSSTVVPSGYSVPDKPVSPDDREHFVWVGRLDPRQKRPHLFLDLAERCPEATFQLIGPRGQNEAYNKQICTRASEIKNLTYIGPVSPERVHEYYRTAIALVNTSKHEGFPSTFLEAWRYKTPVLSLEIPLSRFSHEPADRGFAGGKMDSLVKLVDELNESTFRRAEVSEPAYEYFLQNLTINEVAEIYGDVLRGACSP